MGAQLGTVIGGTAQRMCTQGGAWRLLGRLQPSSHACWQAACCMRTHRVLHARHGEEWSRMPDLVCKQQGTPSWVCASFASNKAPHLGSVPGCAGPILRPGVEQQRAAMHVRARTVDGPGGGRGWDVTHLQQLCCLCRLHRRALPAFSCLDGSCHEGVCVCVCVSEKAS